jgi:hypothetical protein
MHLTLVAKIFGMDENTVALLFSGAAIIFIIRRWRMNVIRRRDARQSEQLNALNARGAPSETSPAFQSQPNPLNVREIATELAALLADLEETARRAAAQIENRRTGLELVLKEADEKIRRLETLTKAAIPERGGGAEPRPAALSADAAQLITRLRQERGALGGAAGAASAPPSVEDPAYRPIYQLADAGKSPREIAQQLNRQPGEVELILALRPRQRA